MTLRNSRFADGFKKLFAGIGITNDALNVSIQGRSFPEQWYVQADGAVGTNDEDTIYESGDVSMYNCHIIENMSAGAGALEVLVSIDGTNYSSTPVGVEIMSNATDALKDVSVAQNEVGILRGKFAKILVRQNGATAADARVAHGVE